MFKWSIKVFKREASLSASASSEVLEPRELLGCAELTTDDSFHLAALFLDEAVDKVDIVDSFLDDLQCWCIVQHSSVRKLFKTSLILHGKWIERNFLKSIFNPFKEIGEDARVVLSRFVFLLQLVVPILKRVTSAFPS